MWLVLIALLVETVPSSCEDGARAFGLSELRTEDTLYYRAHTFECVEGRFKRTADPVRWSMVTRTSGSIEVLDGDGKAVRARGHGTLQVCTVVQDIKCLTQEFP